MMRRWIWILWLLLPIAIGQAVQTCDESNSQNSIVYCSGPLLDAVNILKLYPDSKTFVDMPLKFSAEEIMANYTKTFGEQLPNPILLKRFVDDHFFEAGTELSDVVPEDWKEKPSKLMEISDPNLRQWAMDLNGIWKKLCKKMKSEIAKSQDRFSLLYVPNPFIASGGRFREFYYWDAYWIVKGLIASEMHISARHMIENLATMVTNHGFVPNGGRVYYLQRSQPPLLTGMLYEYYEATGDIQFLKQIVPILEQEFDFWNNNRTVSVNGVNYYQYRSMSNVPRPESYTEDIESASTIPEKDRTNFFHNMASTAESGWDFSSRWFADAKTLETVETTQIVPVDLNAFIYMNMDILQYFHQILGNVEEAKQWGSERESFQKQMHDLFYNETQGTWCDYNLRTRSHNTRFYPSMAVPLFAGVNNRLDKTMATKTYHFMRDLGVFGFTHGIPASIVANTSQQWDFPNGWSNLNHMIIEGFRKSDDPEMQQKAFELAEKWVLGNYEVWESTKHMWEKYSVIGEIPQPGSGGEYNVQDGFGWTNGVILDLLVTYKDRLTAPHKEKPETKSANRCATALIISFLISLSIF